MSVALDQHQHYSFFEKSTPETFLYAKKHRFWSSKVWVAYSMTHVCLILILMAVVTELRMFTSLID